MMDWINNDNEMPKDFELSAGEIAGMGMGVQLFFTSEHNPEDTLFVSLTQRETIVMKLGLIMLNAAATRSPELERIAETIRELSDKVADACVTQKAPEGY